MKSIHLLIFLATKLALVSFTSQLIPDETEDTITVGFGYECNSLYSCDISRGLICNGGVCECLRPDSTIYDEDKITCVARAGKPCLIEVKGFKNKNGSNELELPCLRNSQSYCDVATKQCACDEYFLLSENGGCVPKRLFRQNCSTSSDCRRDLGLVCVDNQCICDLDRATYDGNNHPNVCVGKVDKPCVAGLCTSNAVCVDNPNQFRVNSDDENPYFQIDSVTTPRSRPVGIPRICRCADDFGPTLSGLCVKGYGKICGAERACRASFKCGRSGYCECADSENQFHDHLLNTCVAKIGTVCTANHTNNTDHLDNPNIITCMHGGHCVKEQIFLENGNATYAHVCRCTEGFVDNGEYCDLDYGQPCGENGDSYGLDCDWKGKLACIHGKCDCSTSLHEYDVKAKACLGLAGATCSTWAQKKDDPTGKRDLDERLKTCVNGARCARSWEPIEVQDAISNDVNGVCKCIKTELPGGRCKDDGPAVIMIWFSATVIFLGVLFFVCLAWAKRLGLSASHELSEDLARGATCSES